ncbi:hypothetical protein MMC29_000846 [Sticta canariensis]|nr:hypothetical protein [Sticta canariensis]
MSMWEAPKVSIELQKVVQESLAEENSTPTNRTKPVGKRPRNNAKGSSKPHDRVLTPTFKQRKGFHAASIGEMFAGLAGLK